MSEPPVPPPFAPPAAEAAPGPVAAPLPGGQFPEIGPLFSETMTEFTKNIGPYALAGLGQLVALVPIVFVAIFAIYGVMIGWMLAMFGAIFAAMSALPQDVAGIVAVLVEIVMFFGLFALIIGIAGAMGALVAPMAASLARGVAAQQRGEGMLDFSSAFDTLTRDLLKVMGLAFVLALAGGLGAMMCYLPAFVVILFTCFAALLVALHRRNPFVAIHTNTRHVLSNPSWHLVFGAIYVGILLVSAYVPVLGPMFVLALQVRAYRHLFGDGEEPVTGMTEY